jgi:hypothetical protein
MKSDRKRLVKCIVIFLILIWEKNCDYKCPSLILLEFGFSISKNLLAQYKT